MDSSIEQEPNITWEHSCNLVKIGRESQASDTTYFQILLFDLHLNQADKLKLTRRHQDDDFTVKYVVSTTKSNIPVHT